MADDGAAAAAASHSSDDDGPVAGKSRPQNNNSSSGSGRPRSDSDDSKSSDGSNRKDGGDGSDSEDSDSGFRRKKRGGKKKVLRRGGRVIAADGEEARQALAEQAARRQAAAEARARAAENRKSAGGGGKPRKPKAAGDQEEDEEEDDEDEEDDDEEEDDGGRASGKKRKRKDWIRSYFEEAAEEGSDEEDEDDDDGRGGKRSRQEESGEAYARIKAEAEAMRERRKKDKTAEQIAREIEERAADYINRDDDDEAGGILGGYYEGVDVDANEEDMDLALGTGLSSINIQRRADLPDVRDPRLWMMRCKDGAEPEIMVALLNKYVAKAESGEAAAQMGIMSAVCTGKGTIYVEAYREAQVKAAVTGISDLYGWKPGAITLVPIDQMTNVVTVKSERTIFKRNQFARITMGVFKGDLCQILQVLNGGTSLLVTLVPRINLQLLALPKDQKPKGFAAGIASGGGRGSRAPQRFFDRTEILEASNGSAVIESRTRYGMRLDVLGTNQYSGGMLVKEVKSSQVTAFGPPPTLEEISKFRGAAQRASSSSNDNEDDENGAGGSGAKAADAEEALLQAIESAKQAGVGIAGISTGTSSSSSSSSSAAASGPVAGSGGGITGGQGAGGSLLLPGDSVVVVKGDLTGLSGKVVVLNGSTFTLQPSAESAAALGLTERLEIPCEEAMKTFNIGDHVKAIGGLYIGETGTVIALKHVPAPANASGDAASTATWLATILLDSGGMKQVQAFVRDLTRSTDVVTSTAGNVEGYELHDLVELDSGIGSADGPDGSGGGGGTEAGVIIALGQRDVTVLMTTGVPRTVPVQHLRGKINMRSERSQATDILGQALEVGDVVKVQQGSENKDRTGTIKHIHRFHLFLHDFTRPMHSGMFVARSRMCVLAGTRVKAPGTIPASNAASALGAGAFGRGQPVARGGAAGPGYLRRPAVDDFAGATVRIIKGPQKGKIGIVKSMTFSHVAVEMHSGLKTLSFPRDAVQKIDARVSGAALGAAAASAGQGMRPGAAPIGSYTPYIGGGGTTPAYGLGAAPGAIGGATPAYGMGGATPAFGGGVGGATPGYGGGAATPGYGAGGQTPGYGGAAAAVGGAYGAQTPMYGSKTPQYGGQFGPGGMGGQTPAYQGGQTPAFANQPSYASSSSSSSSSAYGGGGEQTPGYGGAGAASARLPAIEPGSAPWWVPGVVCEIFGSSVPAIAKKRSMTASPGGTLGPVVILEVLAGGTQCKVSDQVTALKESKVTSISQLKSSAFTVPTVDLCPQMPRMSEPCFFVQSSMADVLGTKGLIVSVNLEDEEVQAVAAGMGVDPLDLGLKDKPNGYRGAGFGVDPHKVDFICRCRDLSEAGEVEIFNGNEVVRMLTLP